MTDKKDIQDSKFLSLILRHKPDKIGLILDENGWAFTQNLILKANAAGFKISSDRLKWLVQHNDKQRFIFSDDLTKIRANQGHSLTVDLQFKEEVPPTQLYHGTAEKNLPSIKMKGLIKGKRHHVHLSTDQETARQVGSRYGKPIVLIVRAGQMHQDGITFYLSENKVWLTDLVIPEYIIFPS